MSYRILSSNVIVGDANANIPFYSLITTPGGEFQIERLDGNASILSVGGNVSADHMILSSLATQNRVITTDSAGRFILTNFDANGLGNATALTTGVVPSDRLQGSYTLANLTASGTVTANTLVGAMDASNITSGILPAGRLSGDYSFANLMLSDTLMASTLTANISANDLTSGTLSDDRLSGVYAFDSLSLTSNLAAAWLNANINAANITTGTLPDDRLQGAYTFDALTVSNVLTANNVNIPTLLGSNVLISNGNGYIVSSNVTQTELGFVSGVVSPIQTQINQLANGNIVGSNIANLNANNITIGTLPDGRLSGSYTFENLTLSGNLVANTISGNLNASQLTSGIVPSGRLAGDYTIGNLTASTVTASSVSGNLNASQLASGTVPDGRLSGSYTFGSLTLTGNVTANTVHANIDAGSIASGTIDNARLDLENLTTNITPASAGLSIGTAGNTWTTVHADTVNVDDVLLGNSIMYNGNAVVVDLEQTTRNIVPTSTTYTIGKSGTPWSHIYAGNVIATDVIVSGQLLNSDLSPYIDLSNAETNVVPVSGGLSIGTVPRPWQNVVANAATVQSLTINGNVTTSIVPSTTGLNLGSAIRTWGNVYADELHGNIDTADIYGELDANVIFTGGSIDDFVIKVPAGTAGQPGLRFTDDDDTGLFLLEVGNVGVSVDGQTSLTIDSSAVTVSGNLVPSSNISYDLGSQANAWRDVHIANAIYAGPISIVDGAIAGVGDVTSTGNVTAENVIASGSVSATTLIGNLDAGYLTSGTIDSARIAGDYSVANLTITGNANIGGTTMIQPSGHIIPAANLVYDLGSSTNVWRDIYLSGSTIHLGNATISETAGNVVISKLNVSGSLTADGLQVDLSISNVQICDSSWTPVDDTHVGLSEGYILANGAGFAPGMLVQIGGTNATATSYVNSTQLRVQTPAKSTGTYDVTVIRGDTKTATLASAVSYSQDVTWITSTSLGNADWGTPSTISLQAESDSNITYSNITSIPGTLNSSTGLLSFTLPRYEYSTYSFDISATDEQYQDAVRTFLLTSRSDILTKMQASRDTANIHTTGLVTSVPNSTHTGANSYPYGKPVVLPSGNVLIPPNQFAGAKVYNPTNNTISVPAQIPGSPTGYRHSCALHDGRVMLFKVGGYKAAIYTESSDSWTFTTPNLEPGVQLYDGRIFSRPTGGFYTLYDIGTDSVVQYATSLTNNASMILLDNGNVFGGVNYSTVWTYNPYTNSFTDITSAFQSFASRGCHARCLLPDGRVFSNVYDCNASQGAIIYDPADGTVMQTPSFPGSGTAAFYDCCILPDGRVLVPRYISGVNHAIYNPVTNTVQSMYAPNIEQRSMYVCATKNGKALITPLDNQAGSVYIFTPDSTVPDTWANDDPIHYHVASASTA